MKGRLKIFRTVVCAGLLSCCLLAAGCGGNMEEGSGAETAKLRVTLVCTQDVPDTELIQDEANILLAGQGIEVELIPIEFGSIQQQMNLLVTGGDDSVDVFSSKYWSNLSALVSNGQVLALDEYLEKYPEIGETIGEEYLACGAVGEQTFGLPVITGYGLGTGYVLRKDLADECGITIDPDRIYTLEEFTDIMTQIQTAHPELCMIPTSTAGVYGPGNIDPLGDSTNLLGVLGNYGQDTTVINYYESEEYYETLEYFKKWKALGFYMDDPLNSTDGLKSYIKSGKAAGSFSNSFDMVCQAQTDSVSTGYELAGIRLDQTLITTTGVNTGMWHISAGCKNPDAAVRFLKELYTNQELATLLSCGIEGRHYQMNGKTATYAEGTDATSAAWSLGIAWYWPNQTLTPPWEPQAEDYFDRMLSSNENALRSKALGFTFDSSPVTNEMTACINVVNQYKMALEVVETDIDETLPQFQMDLKAAGIDRIVEEKQRQLDEWLAQNQ
ncbi:MAG TPA: ABC transporter substrate-binding protein [Candidatus Eisenbergiella merdavium]|uniref:ABC transporter substrate-binding protein n=1 Tax=Candidatus Eisenbergiella merdavium TaxID=2838551 RepID=A0A9D2NG42_9FIRM|nr:ABC transporter substrate-binding protein [Candidatus Eisenbergiella merdavium]